MAITVSGVVELLVGEADGVVPGEAQETVAAAIAGEGAGVVAVIPPAVELDDEALGRPEAVDVDLLAGHWDVDALSSGREMPARSTRERKSSSRLLRVTV